MSQGVRDIAAILVDWGTSNLRLWAVDSSQNVLATHREASGMRTLTPDAFEAILMSCLDRLGAGHAECPIIMCGMVGSRQGWTDAGYVPVPASLATLPGKAVRIKTRGGYDARILPGIARHDPQLPDVMRSEETQLLGLKSLMGGQDLHGLVCMPGSHAKWVHLAGGVVSGFHTAITGELIASVTSSTVVRHAFDGAPGMLDVPPYNAVFRIAVEHALKAPANILNAVFATRPRVLLNEANASDSAAWLSGSVIGSDVAAALQMYQAGPNQKVHLIGGGRQGPLYETALDMAGFHFETVDADDASVAGLLEAATQIWPNNFTVDDTVAVGAMHR